MNVPTTERGAASGTPTGVVGVIVNPVAGKDVRRLSTGATHTPDTTKMGIVRRVVAAAAESGATTLLLADDPHRLARRATERLDLPDRVDVRLLGDHVSGSRRDTIGAAAQMRDLGADVVVVLGGDGTCRDAATGWPDLPLIAISTGTNNVYPTALDGTSAGVAAGLVAAGIVPFDRVAQPTKRIVVRIDRADADPIEDVALVDLALVDARFVGARAVKEPTSIVQVVAAIGDPASTGLSAIAGRTHPVDRHTRGGVAITLAAADHADDAVTRRVRVPLSPGTFDTLPIADVRPIADGEPVELVGPGVLAFDGERDLPIAPGVTAVAHIERTGPRLIDVAHAVSLGAFHEVYDLTDGTDHHADVPTPTSPAAVGARPPGGSDDAR